MKKIWKQLIKALYIEDILSAIRAYTSNQIAQKAFYDMQTEKARHEIKLIESTMSVHALAAKELNR